MADPRDIMTSMVHPEAQADFMAERKRLREVRARWVEENEKPIAVLMCECPKCRLSQLKDRESCIRCGESLEKAILLANPFLTGCQTYPEDRHYEPDPAGGYKRPEITFIGNAQTGEQAKVSDQLQEVAKQYNQFSGITTRDRSGADVSFSHKSDHPPMLEGETHEEWFTRVSNAYSKAPESAADARGTGADIDGIRPAAGDDPSGEGSGYTDGAGDSGGTADAALDRGAVSNDPGGPQSERGPLQYLSKLSGSAGASIDADSTDLAKRVARRLRSLWGNRQD